MTKVLSTPSAAGFAAAYIITYLRAAPHKRSFLAAITRQMIDDDVVPWGNRKCYYNGVSTLMSRVAAMLGPRQKEVLGYSKVEGWFFKDEATADEIVQGGSTRMRSGFKQTSNALDDIDEGGTRSAMADDLKALGELIDEFRGQLG